MGVIQRIAAWRRFRRMSRALAELDRLDRDTAAGVPPPRERTAPRRFPTRGEVLFLLAIPALAGLLYLLGHRFPSLVDPPGDRVRAPASTGTGPYAFMATSPDGQAVAYSSCRPIDYVVNPAGMPPEGPRLIADAIGQVSTATGLKFTDEGATTEPPSEHRPVRQPDRYHQQWAPVLIAWSTPDQYPALRTAGAGGDLIEGVGGSTSLQPGGSQVSYYVTGEVVLSRDALAQLLRRPTGYVRARAVLLHELGHLVGLNHVQDRNELMDPVLSGLTGYGPGDRAGLARLGQGPCIADPH